MTPTLTPFPMYDFPELADAHETYRRHFSALVRRAGLANDPPLTQMCGYPLATSLRGRFDAIATPVYDVPFSKGATHCGLIVVGAETPLWRLEDLRGTRFALNGRDSNTGMNLPRHLIAPLAEHGTFFRSIIETGSHLASLAAIQGDVADAASVDNVTFALLAQHRPAAVAGIRVLTPTASSPTLPFVVPASTSGRVRTVVYDALASTVEQLRDSDASRTLHLIGIERASIVTFDPLLAYEREAATLRYGALR